MTAVAVKGSSGEPMKFTQSQATAALRTCLVHMVNSADGTDATGATLTVTLSKAGAAFGAMAGAVTELTGGWYKIVLTAVDVGTLGALGMHVTASGVDTLNVVHEVVALDLMTPTVNPGAGGITSAAFASGALAEGVFDTGAIDAASIKADAITAIQSGLATATEVSAVNVPTITKTVALGTIAADGASSGVDCNKAVAVTLNATGTFGGGTVQVQVCADPTAASPVWVNVSGATLTSNGSKAVTLPVRAVRWNMSGSTSPSVVCTATVQYPTGH